MATIVDTKDLLQVATNSQLRRSLPPHFQGFRRVVPHHDLHYLMMSQIFWTQNCNQAINYGFILEEGNNYRVYVPIFETWVK